VNPFTSGIRLLNRSAKAASAPASNGTNTASSVTLIATAMLTRLVLATSRGRSFAAPRRIHGRLRSASSGTASMS
jgi:hypothetical protein